MKHQIWSMTVLSLFLLATGCGVGGFWMTGNPSAGQNIKPYLQKWKKVGVTPEMRREDAFNCGGKRSDTHPDQVDNDEELMLPNENIFDTRKRLLEMWKACMSDKEYHYHRQ
mgnify:CR=1 FL=1